MLRRAVIQHLKQVTDLGGRVYQAFLAPADAARPYVTVKLVDGGASTRISFAGDHVIEIRVYDDLNSFIGLDVIIQAVIGALHGKNVTDTQSGEQYEVWWVPSMNDFVEEERKLIGRLVRFRAASIFERG
jgi:hypothetical protein